MRRVATEKNNEMIVERVKTSRVVREVFEKKSR
jgi:hypothetical protein